MADIPRNLPGKWIITTFGQMAGFINGYAFAPDDWRENGLPIIRIEQLRDENAKADYYDRPLQERYRIRNGDLIFSWSASLITRLWDRGDAYLNQHLFKVQNCSGVDRVFLKYLIDFNIDAMASETHGSTMKHITRPALLNYKVQIPINPDEQRQIADILSILDEAIAWSEALVRKYHSIKQGLVSDLLTYGVYENGELRPPREEAPELYRQTPLGWLPKDWEVVPIGEKNRVEVGGTPSTSISEYWQDGNIPWMSSSDVYARRIFDVSGRITLKGLRASNAKLIIPPTVAMALAGQGKTRGTVALTNMELCTNQSVALIKPTGKDLNTTFLFYDLESRYNELRSISMGAGRAGLSKRVIEKIYIPIPHSEEQQIILHILETQDDLIEAEKINLRKLIDLKQGLMQDLLSGQVRVGRVCVERY